MKKFLLLILMSGCNFSVFAQRPSKMSYQTLIRDDVDKLASKSLDRVQINISQGSKTGSPIYKQCSTQVNANSLMNVIIGERRVVFGDFSPIIRAKALYYIETPTHPDRDTNVVTLEQFGGVSGDDTIDNTSALTEAISYLLANNGGTLQLKGGIYEFKTPFKSKVPLKSIKIQGAGMWAGHPTVTGTLLNYSGSGFFLNFVQGGQYSELKDLSISCNGANGILLKEGVSTVNKFTIEKVRINGFKRGIDVRDFAYVYLDRLELLAPYSFYKINTSVEFGIRVGAGSGIKEFIYITNTNVDAAASGTNRLDAGVSGNGIEIRDSNNVYLTDCDIANWGSGKAIYLHTEDRSLWGVFMRNINIIRADGGVEFFENRYHITQVSIQDLMFVHRGLSNTERGIYNHRNGKNVLVGAYFDKVYFRKLGSTSPNYDIEINGCAEVKLGYYHSLSGGSKTGIK